MYIAVHYVYHCQVMGERRVFLLNIFLCYSAIYIISMEIMLQYVHILWIVFEK